MIVTDLEITNFRNYVGTHKIDLSVDSDHNIILIGGQNGAGKTSMVDAIRLCLYGNRFDGVPLSDQKYQKYLQSVYSKNSIGPMSISLNITADEDNSPMAINVKRQFVVKNDKITEELSLRKGDSKVELIDLDYWSYFVEKIIPPASSKFFFFDGEKVRDTISSDSSKQFLSDAVDNLTGISKLKTLRKDLIEVRKRIISRTSSPNSKAIALIKESIDEVTKEINEKTESLECSNGFVSGYAEKLTDLEDERSRLIGSTSEKRGNYDAKLDESNAGYDDSNRAISDFCYSKLPFFLANESIGRTVKQAEDENSDIIYEYSISALKELIESPKFDEIIKSDPSESIDVLNAVIAEFSTRIQTKEKVLNIPLFKVKQLESSVPVKEDIDEFLENVYNRENYIHEINNLKKKISKLSDNSLEELDSNIMTLKTEIGVLKRQIEIDEAQLKTLNSKLASLNSDLGREERLIVLTDVDKETIKNIDLVMGNIDDKIEIILDDSRNNLENKINEIYHILKNTKDMVKAIRITESFEIQLFDFDDKIIDISFISEGEKGILMYSVIYGLHSISNSNFPLIVDSPLGRMDTKHVHNLAEKYFPSINAQIILLSHDREVIGESHEILKKNICKSYTVRKTEKPKVINGYFE